MTINPTAVAIVNTANCPLLIRTSYDNIDENEATNLIYLLHASLDIVQEKAEQPTSRDNFLGVLYQCEQYKIYGLMSTTKVKILLMISQRDYNYSPARESDIRLLLKNIHKAFVDATAMNPFYRLNELVNSKRLDAYLDTIFATTGTNSVAAGDGTVASSNVTTGQQASASTIPTAQTV